MNEYMFGCLYIHNMKLTLDKQLIASMLIISGYTLCATLGSECIFNFKCVILEVIQTVLTKHAEYILVFNELILQSENYIATSQFTDGAMYAVHHGIAIHRNHLV